MIDKVLAFVIVVTVAGCAASEESFSADDEAEVRALEEAYRGAWLTNDSSAVMATLALDAVLMPGGLEPIQGDSAIRAYWWPADGSSTMIESYEIVVHEVHGSGDLAFLRGHGMLAFEYRSSTGATSRITSEATHLSVAQRNVNGEWRIARRAWSAIR